MGAPKQKWTAEEEAALKAGVVKHGAGKWRTILIDPEFSAILRTRSNVDLKDKWRNINVTAIWGSRQKAKLALKKNQLTPKRDGNALALTTVRSDEEVVDAKPLAISGGPLSSGNSRERMKRLDGLIMEAITNLKEPSGSDRAAIAAYIEDQFWAPPNFKKLISAKLKLLIANGKLIKVKHRYRIAPNSRTAESRKGTIDGRPKDSPAKSEKRELKIFTKSQIEEELSKMRSMTAQEAAAAAARAVAEAEVAIAEAEEAAREAEAAEAEAEAAQLFAQAAFNALKCRATIQTCLDKTPKKLLPLPQFLVPNSPTRPLKPFSASTETQTQKLERIADELISLTRLERFDYSILFLLKIGLNNYGPAVVPSPSSSSAAGKSSSSSPGVAAEEKMVLDVKLEKYDAVAKIKVIKEVRGFTDLGLKESDLVEKVPAVVKKGVTKEEGNAILDKLKQLGTTVVLE